MCVYMYVCELDIANRMCAFLCPFTELCLWLTGGGVCVYVCMCVCVYVYMRDVGNEMYAFLCLCTELCP